MSSVAKLFRPVVTIKVFFVKENFDKVFDETLIVTTVKEIFDWHCVRISKCIVDPPRV
jgi:hypothetical protein